MTLRFTAFTLCVYLAGFVCELQAAPQKRFEYKSTHMGTEWRIVLYAADSTTADAAAKAAFARVAELDAIMSDYDPKSELMRLCFTNDAKPGEPMAVSADLFDVLQKGQQVGKQSEGSFDMTVGPMVKLWRTARKSKELPAAAELAKAKELIGSEKLILDPKARTVTLKRAGMRLDLGGIGKGYGADAALAVLRKQGVSRALIAASGDVTVGDPPPDRDSWIVEIAPLAKGRPARFVKLANASVSTSGDLFQFVEIGDVRYSHVLDPKTGLGLTGRRSATVIAKQGWQADALTKAASVLPPEQALTIIESIEGAAMFVVVKETDEAKEQATQSKRFADFEAKED